MREARPTKAPHAERGANVLPKGDVRQGTQGRGQLYGPNSGLWVEAEIGDPHSGGGEEALSLLGRPESYI